MTRKPELHISNTSTRPQLGDYVWDRESRRLTKLVLNYNGQRTTSHVMAEDVDFTDVLEIMDANEPDFVMVVDDDDNDFEPWLEWDDVMPEAYGRL